MKRLLFLLIVAPVFCFGQKPISYTEAINITGSKQELFERARRWFSETFVDSKSVLNIQDKESGELVGKGSVNFSSNTFWGSDGTRGYITFKISVFTKDGRYKYIVSDFTHDGNPANGLNLSFGLITDEVECPKQLPRQRKKWEDKLWTEIKSDIALEMDRVIPSLKSAMLKSNDF